MIDSIHQSHLGTWLRCGEQFRRRYIEDDIIPPGIAARRGTAVHKAAEINHRHKVDTGEDLPKGDLTDAAVETYRKAIVNDGVFIPRAKSSEKARLLQEGEDHVVGATGVYRDEIAPEIRPALVEQFMHFDIGEELPVAGTLDVADEAGNIIDLKVMKKKNQAWADAELQPSFYYALYKELTGSWPKAFRYEVMVPNKTVVHDQLTTQRNNHDMMRLRLYIRAFLSDYNAGIFRPADPGHWLCSPDWCGYFYSCKYSSRRAA